MEQNDMDKKPTSELSEESLKSTSKISYIPDGQEIELRKKLNESKTARKKAEDNAQILLNRLLLLKNEEQKVFLIAIQALKKIAETQQKTDELMQAQKRNEETRKKREEVNKALLIV